MEEQWDIMEFRTFIYNIKQGEISIQEPIHIHNKTRDIISNISFLDYLLKYKNIHKQNIFLLYQIFMQYFVLI